MKFTDLPIGTFFKVVRDSRILDTRHTFYTHKRVKTGRYSYWNVSTDTEYYDGIGKISLEELEVVLDNRVIITI